MGGDPAAALHFFWAVARDLSRLGQRCPDVSVSCPEQHCPTCPGVSCPDTGACYQLVGELAAAARGQVPAAECPEASCGFPWLLIVILCVLALCCGVGGCLLGRLAGRRERRLPAVPEAEPLQDLRPLVTTPTTLRLRNGAA